MSLFTTDRETTALMGAVTAPATHDLMNVLAIINEHTGLLSDLLHLNGSGDLSPEQLTKGLTAIETQVARGRALLTQLNRLAHAPDPNPGTFDAGAAAAEVVLLTQRRFYGRLASGVPSHAATCDPMAFRLLIFRLLEAATHPTQAEELPVTLARHGTTLHLTLQGHPPLTLPDTLPRLAESIGATLTCRENALTLSLPST